MPTSLVKSRHAALGLLSYSIKTLKFIGQTIALNWRLSRRSSDADDSLTPYGIDREHAHARALQLVPDDFFWDCTDELAPFGSDEGDTALDDYRQWRRQHPKARLKRCLRWVIEEVGEMKFADYDVQLLNKEIISKQMDDADFDSDQFIYTLDVSVIATVFGQLVDEGGVDFVAKFYGEIALRRQIIYSELSTQWPHRAERIRNLCRLLKILAIANEPT